MSGLLHNGWVQFAVALAFTLWLLAAAVVMVDGDWEAVEREGLLDELWGDDE